MSTIMYDPQQTHRISLSDNLVEEITKNISCKQTHKSLIIRSIPFLGLLPSTISPQFIAISIAGLIFMTFMGLCSEEKEKKYSKAMTKKEVKREISRYLHSFGSPYEAQLDYEDIDRLEQKVLDLLERNRY